MMTKSLEELDWRELEKLKLSFCKLLSREEFKIEILLLTSLFLLRLNNKINFFNFFLPLIKNSNI